MGKQRNVKKGEKMGKKWTCPAFFLHLFCSFFFAFSICFLFPFVLLLFCFFFFAFCLEKSKIKAKKKQTKSKSKKQKKKKQMDKSIFSHFLPMAIFSPFCLSFFPFFPLGGLPLPSLMEPAQEIWSVQHWCRAFLWHLGGLPLPSLPVHWRKTVTVTCSGWRTWWQISWQLRTKKSPIECPRLASELHLAAWSDLCQEILPQVQSMQANSHPSPAEHHHSCWMQSGTQEIARWSQQTATSMPSIRRAPRQ